eukprot:365610-Chlamydomonas_euryale.AAC.2
MAVLPDASDVGLQRELASIHRCDLAVVCSAAEEQLLLTVRRRPVAAALAHRCLAVLWTQGGQVDVHPGHPFFSYDSTSCTCAACGVPQEYKICREKVVLSSFFYDAAPPLHNLPPYAERAHFVTIGIFKHAPNMDSYRCGLLQVWTHTGAEGQACASTCGAPGRVRGAGMDMCTTVFVFIHPKRGTTVKATMNTSGNSGPSGRTGQQVHGR